MYARDPITGDELWVFAADHVTPEFVTGCREVLGAIDGPPPTQRAVTGGGCVPAPLTAPLGETARDAPAPASGRVRAA